MRVSPGGMPRGSDPVRPDSEGALGGEAELAQGLCIPAGPPPAAGGETQVGRGRGAGRPSFPLCLASLVSPVAGISNTPGPGLQETAGPGTLLVTYSLLR